jgi:hypothetical protein
MKHAALGPPQPTTTTTTTTTTTATTASTTTATTATTATATAIDSEVHTADLLQVLDLGAGHLNMLPRVLELVRGANNMNKDNKGAFAPVRRLRYVAVEGNPNVLSGAVKALKKLGLVPGRCHMPICHCHRITYDIKPTQNTVFLSIFPMPRTKSGLLTLFTFSVSDADADPSAEGVVHSGVQVIYVIVF